MMQRISSRAARAGRTSAALWLLAMLGWPAFGASLTRGPYLQMATPTSIVVRWRTDAPTTSRVFLGAAPAGLVVKAAAPGVLTEHVVLVNGLKPDTRYYYGVGTTNEVLAGGSTNFFFVTAPPPGSERPTRILVLGDPGTGAPGQRAVRDAYQRFTGARPTDLWLMLGDNAYDSGTDAQYQTNVFDVYRDLFRNSVLWPTLGNHDGRSASSATQSGVYYDIFTLPTLGQSGGVLSGTEAYYSFNHANLHLICLDSHDSDRSTNGLMLSWLKRDLAANQAEWTIAFWHHPPYTKGGHDSDSVTNADPRMREMRMNFLPVLEAGGTDLVLCGHSHSYERSALLDGCYGSSETFTAAMRKQLGDGRPDAGGPYRKPAHGPAPHSGTVYVVAGSSGQVSGGKLNHPAMLVSTNSLGSLVLDVAGPRLDATFLNAQGVSLDHFSIVKGAR